MAALLFYNSSITAIFVYRFARVAVRNVFYSMVPFVSSKTKLDV